MMMRRLCPCCCADEEREPFVAHDSAISSDDPQPAGHELRRTSEEVAAEAMRTQEWCLEHLAETQPLPSAHDSNRRSDARRQRKLKQQNNPRQPAAARCDELEIDSQSSTWTPTDLTAEADLDAAVAELLPAMEAVPSAALVAEARRAASSIPALLAAAELVASRAPADGGVLTRSGCLRWLEEGLGRADVLSSSAATHRLCYALRCMLDAAALEVARSATLPGSEQLLGGGQLRRSLCDGGQLSRSLCEAIRRHEAFAPLCTEALLCLAGASALGGGAAVTATLSAGGAELALEWVAMRGGGALALEERQAAGASALAALLGRAPALSVAADGSAMAASTLLSAPVGGGGAGEARRRAAASRVAAIRILSLGGVGALTTALQAHATPTAASDALLSTLVGLFDALAPPFELAWAEVEAELEVACLGGMPLVSGALLEPGGGVAAAEDAEGSGRGSGGGGGGSGGSGGVADARAKASRHAAKVSLHLIAAAILLASPPPTAARARAALQLLGALAKLSTLGRRSSPKLWLGLERSLPAAARAEALLRVDRDAATAACELLALLSPDSPPPKEMLSALLGAARGTREDDEDAEATPSARGGCGGDGRGDGGRDADEGGADAGADAGGHAGGDAAHVAWSAALVGLCCRPRPSEAAAAAAATHLSLEALMAAALKKADASATARPLSLLAIGAALASLPPTRAADAAAQLCAADSGASARTPTISHDITRTPRCPSIFNGSTDR